MREGAGVGVGRPSRGGGLLAVGGSGGAGCGGAALTGLVGWVAARLQDMATLPAKKWQYGSRSR